MSLASLSLTDFLRSDGKLWVVMLVVGIVLSGWLFYILRIGSRVRKLEKRNKR
ncbi:CcmD family protein [Hymenobacter agri]